MRYFLLLLIAFTGWKFCTSPRGTESAQAFPREVINEPTGIREIPTEARQRVLLFTGTSWCPACKHLDSTVISKPEWDAFTANEIRFLKFDVSPNSSERDPQVQRLIEQYGIRSFPTMIVIGSDHQKLDESVGSGAPIENYKQWIRAHANAASRIAAN